MSTQENLNKWLQRSKESISDWNFIFREELKNIFRDQGVFLFMVLVPLLYPLLYAFIYNQETVREVPAAVVDDSHTALSREYIRQVDAAPDVKVVAQCADMEEAKRLVKHRDAYGIIHLPASFSDDVVNMQQAHVDLYVDMAGMLYYKALLLANTEVSLKENAKIKVQQAGGYTDADDALVQHPIEYRQVDMYNPQVGFASFLIPGVLILVLQQTLLLGVGMLGGTARERNSYAELIPINRHYNGLLRIVLGKGAAYLLIYLWNAVFVLGIVPHIFNLPQIGNPFDIWCLTIVFLLDVIFFAMTLSVLIRRRETCIIFFVFSSLILLFLSGISWPKEAMPRFWRLLSYVFPSTFGVNGFVKINNMGASLVEIKKEMIWLMGQTAFYFGTTLLVYRNNIAAARRRLEQKKSDLRERKAQREHQQAAEA